VVRPRLMATFAEKPSAWRATRSAIRSPVQDEAETQLAKLEAELHPEN